MEGSSRLRAAAGTGRSTLLAVGVLVAGVLLTWFAGARFTYAAGLAGTPGRLRVDACVWEHSGGHRYPHCSGTFRSSDGSVVKPGATLETHVSVGTTVALQRTATGGYVRTGAAAIFGWLALSLLGLMTLLTGALAVYGRAGVRRVPRAPLVLLGSLGAVMLLSALIGGLAGLGMF